ncbi:ArsR/SmtB family transcription factor (plasmid) [Priestia megaterium]|uniref:ArsR/SmtB family transcription factor n=1 Tax=Priestia megaterium TaxID=1404 RepID=UPI003899EA90
MAQENRRRIIDLLRARPRSVGELVVCTQLNHPGVSKHLRKLRDAGLVIINKDPQKHIYLLNAKPLTEIDNWLAPYRKY